MHQQVCSLIIYSSHLISSFINSYLHPSYIHAIYNKSLFQPSPREYFWNQIIPPTKPYRVHIFLAPVHSSTQNHKHKKENRYLITKFPALNSSQYSNRVVSKKIPKKTPLPKLFLVSKAPFVYFMLLSPKQPSLYLSPQFHVYHP